jgi:hypothetical protein
MHAFTVHVSMHNVQKRHLCGSLSSLHSDSLLVVLKWHTLQEMWTWQPTFSAYVMTKLSITIHQFEPAKTEAIRD